MKFRMLLLFAFLLTAIVEGKENWQEPSGPNAVNYEWLGRRKFNADKYRLNNFAVFNHTGDKLIVGGRNNMYEISIKHLNETRRLQWNSSRNDIKTCKAKKLTEDMCQNYLLVYARISKDVILICGTNAFNPLCRKYKESFGNYTQVDEFSGKGLCPFSPDYSSVSTFADGELYTATFGRFSGDPLIYRNSVRTTQWYHNQLNEPEFVASFHHEKFVYFFFREKTTDLHCGKNLYSKVSRVCTNDKGYGQNKIKQWTSFFKAPITCSLPGKFPFYFDEIHAVSNIIEKTYKGEGDRILYAGFTIPSNALSGSAVCAFRMKDIENSFEGFFSNHTWRDFKQIPEMCFNDTNAMPARAFQFIRHNCQMKENVRSFLGEPVFVYLKYNCRLSAIAVDPQVMAVNGELFDVIFIGTDCGKIFKAVYINGSSMKRVIIEEIRILNVNAPITKLIVHGDVLIVVTQYEIFSIGTQRCRKKSRSCRECVKLQDPHCAWNKMKNLCVSTKFLELNDSNLVQNIEEGKDGRCALVRPKELSSPSLETTNRKFIG